MLESFSVGTLTDIRTIPKSRYNPQFSQDALAESLRDRKIQYLYLKDLGGLRHPKPDSPNMGWRNKSFRGYADHMRSPEFGAALQRLIALGEGQNVAMMCAEAVPWRCHRSLVADALAARNIAVEHIMSIGKSSSHKPTKFAVFRGQDVTYPPETAELPLFNN